MIRSDLRTQPSSDRNCVTPREVRPQLDIPFPRSFRGSPQTEQSALLCQTALQWACQRAFVSPNQFLAARSEDQRGQRRHGFQLATCGNANCDKSCKMRIGVTRRPPLCSAMFAPQQRRKLTGATVWARLESSAVRSMRRASFALKAAHAETGSLPAHSD